MKTQELMELVAFLKDDGKYTKRLAELEEREAVLKNKLSIASTVEAAQALMAKAEAMKAEVKDMEKALKAAHDKRATLLDEAHARKMKELDARELKIADLAKKVAEAQKAADETFAAASEELAAAKKENDLVNERKVALSYKEAALNNKLSRLKALMEE